MIGRIATRLPFSVPVILRRNHPVSNTRKLKPPPSGFDFRKFIQIVQESDLDEETKRQVLVQAAYADRKGRIKDDGRHPQV